MPFTLHFRVDLIFGGIFALIALYMLPAPAGILAAVIIASPTFYLWNHFLGIIMYSAEAILIILLMRKTGFHLLFCATITWFFLLPPLIYFNMQMSGIFFPLAERLFILKYMVNGVFNAAVATALIFLLKLKVSDKKRPEIEMRASEAVINVFIIVTVIPLLIFTLLESRILSASVFAQIHSRHENLQRSISLLIKQWHDQHVATIRQIAFISSNPENAAELKNSITAFCRAQPGFNYIYFTDPDGNGLACIPNDGHNGEASVRHEFSSLQYFKTIVDTGKPLVSGITTGDALCPDPSIVIAEPVYQQNKLAGYVAGALKPHSLATQIQHLLDRDVQIILLDGSNKIVYGSNDSHIGQKHDNHLERAVSIMGGKLTIIPPEQSMPAASSYRNSMILLETRLTTPLNWSLVIEEPMTGYVDQLFELSLSQFLNIAILTLFLVMLSGLIRQYFTVPLQNLSDYTSAIAKNGFAGIDTSAPTSVVFEIRQLIDNFAAALARIIESQNQEKAKNQQLKTTNDMLNEKVAQLKQSRIAVEKAEKSFSMLVDSSPLAIIIADNNGNIDYANAEFTRNTRLSVTRTLNLKELFKQFKPFGRAGFPISSFLESLARRYTGAKHIDTGELCLASSQSNNIFNCVATIIESRCIVIFSDITEAAIAAEEKQRLIEQLQLAQKFESLGTLAGGVAHDFNNILMSIMGYAEISLADLPKSGRLYENINMIQTAAQRAAELTKQMLDFTGKNVFKIEAMDFSALVKEMANLLSVTISKKITVYYDLKDGINALGDRLQLRQIAMNLIVNASEAIGENEGQITVRTGMLDRDNNLLKSAVVSNLDPENEFYAYLEVTDTGCGIAPDTLEKIFDPFFTTKFTGRGLGLAASMGIIKSHRGAISVVSAQGRGTTFVIMLPAAHEIIRETLREEAIPEHVEINGKILLADDEETILSLTEMMLEPYGVELLCASNGAEAVELFKAQEHEIAVVILDMVMPKLNGEEVCKKIKALSPETPIIIASGHSRNETMQRFTTAPFDGFLQKPFRMQDLIKEICAVTKSAADLERSLAHKEPT
jgi:signal transduction histidine kinase/CheY-like chemotaxis protein